VQHHARREPSEAAARILAKLTGENDHHRIDPQTEHAQWERQLENPNRSDRFDFPPDDLMPILIDKYFVEIGAQFPVIYRPAFEKAAKERLHFRDKGFAYVLLLVCALGSGFVDDPRVFIDGHPWSSGWKYFHQVHLVSSSILAPPTLYDLQTCCVSLCLLCCRQVWHSAHACTSLLAHSYLRRRSLKRSGL
jgi:hypothetical protein